MSDVREDIMNELETYTPSKEAQELVRSTPIVMLVGISGAGKDTVIDRLLTEKSDYRHIVSHTTRPMRFNAGVIEQEGVQYHFISWQGAYDMIHRHDFIEVNLYAANLYGTSTTDIARAKQEGKIAITAIEVQGVEEYKRISPDVKALFMLPSSYDVWQERYSKRYGGALTGDSDDLQRRMQTALIELNLALTDDYFTFVINDNLDETVEAVDAIAHSKQAGDQKAARDVVHHLIAALSKDINRASQ